MESSHHTLPAWYGCRADAQRTGARCATFGSTPTPSSRLAFNPSKVLGGRLAVLFISGVQTGSNKQFIQRFFADFDWSVAAGGLRLLAHVSCLKAALLPEPEPHPPVFCGRQFQHPDLVGHHAPPPEHSLVVDDVTNAGTFQPGRTASLDATLYHPLQRANQQAPDGRPRSCGLCLAGVPDPAPTQTPITWICRSLNASSIQALNFVLRFS